MSDCRACCSEGVFRATAVHDCDGGYFYKVHVHVEITDASSAVLVNRSMFVKFASAVYRAQGCCFCL